MKVLYLIVSENFTPPDYFLCYERLRIADDNDGLPLKTTFVLRNKTLNNKKKNLDHVLRIIDIKHDPVYIGTSIL